MLFSTSLYHELGLILISQFISWPPYYLTNKYSLDSTQRMMTKIIHNIRRRSYEERLKTKLTHETPVEQDVI